MIAADILHSIFAHHGRWALKDKPRDMVCHGLLWDAPLVILIKTREGQWRYHEPV